MYSIAMYDEPVAHMLSMLESLNRSYRCVPFGVVFLSECEMSKIV